MLNRLRKFFWKKHGESENSGKIGDNDITLSDIIRGLQYCVNQSREIASLQYTTGLENYFDNTGKPRCNTVRIGENGAMDVPLVCMQNHTALELDEMEVGLDITIKNMALKAPEQISQDSDVNKQENFDRESGYLSRTAFIVDLNSAKLEGGYTKLALKLKFKSDSPPEAVSRVIEKLNGMVSVYPYEEKLDDKKDN